MIETTTIVALVVGLTQIFKKGFKIPTRFAPLLSLAFALTLAIVFGTDPMVERIFAGIMVGLSASGFYSGTKKLIQG